MRLTFSLGHIVRYSFIVGHVVVASYWDPGGWLICGQVKSLVACTMYGALDPVNKTWGQKVKANTCIHSVQITYIQRPERSEDLMLSVDVTCAFCENMLAARVSKKHIIKFTRYNFSILINFILNVIHIQTNHP